VQQFEIIKFKVLLKHHSPIYMFLKKRLYFTAVVTVAIWTLLLWEHFNGGVPSHHILAREDLPEISNWWGGILLPLLTLLLSYRVEKRLQKSQNVNYSKTKFPHNVIIGFILSMLYGLTLATFFSFGNEEMPGFMLMGIFGISIFYPTYRAE
jgi:hypothetical protein